MRVPQSRNPHFSLNPFLHGPSSPRRWLFTSGPVYWSYFLAVQTSLTLLLPTIVKKILRKNAESWQYGHTWFQEGGEG